MLQRRISAFLCGAQCLLLSGFASAAEAGDQGRAASERSESADKSAASTAESAERVTAAEKDRRLQAAPLNDHTGRPQPPTRTTQLAALPPSKTYRAPSRRLFPRSAVLVDPLNLLVFGSLDIALATEFLPHFTASLTTSWVVNQTPAGFNFEQTPETLRVESAGLGPMATWSTGLSYWIGEPFDGFGVTTFYESGFYEVSTEDALGTIDKTQLPIARWMVGGDVYKSYGHFIIGAGAAIGADLRTVDRCISASCEGLSGNYVQTSRSEDSSLNVNGSLSPFALELNFLLGAQF